MASLLVGSQFLMSSLLRQCSQLHMSLLHEGSVFRLLAGLVPTETLLLKGQLHLLLHPLCVGGCSLLCLPCAASTPRGTR